MQVPDLDKIRKIRAQIDAYAPYPATGEVTPVALARRLAVTALMRRARLDATPVSELGMQARYAETDAVCADLAGAVALWALADSGTPELDLGVSRGWPLVPESVAGKSPAGVATLIRDIWESGELGEWLHGLLGNDVAEDVYSLAGQMAKLAAEAEPPAARTSAEWCVWWGGEDPNDCAGRLGYDDEAEAEEMAQWFKGGRIASQQVTRGPWTVPAPAAEAVTAK
jgi:hypothetical protein